VALITFSKNAADRESLSIEMSGVDKGHLLPNA
jgi:hypothetical protein